MNRVLIINGVEDTIRILAPAPACRFQLGDAPERDAQVAIPAPGLYSVLMEGRSYDAFVEEAAAGVVVWIDGRSFAIEVRDPRRWSRKTAGHRAEGVQTIVSPMHGKVVRVLVGPGDPVEPGQGLVVVEAMKMQNEMKSTRAGKVLTVAAREGAAVTAGEILATIE